MQRQKNIFGAKNKSHDDWGHRLYLMEVSNVGRDAYRSKLDKFKPLEVKEVGPSSFEMRAYKGRPCFFRVKNYGTDQAVYENESYHSGGIWFTGKGTPTIDRRGLHTFPLFCEDTFIFNKMIHAYCTEKLILNLLTETKLSSSLINIIAEYCRAETFEWNAKSKSWIATVKALNAFTGSQLAGIASALPLEAELILTNDRLRTELLSYVLIEFELKRIACQSAGAAKIILSNADCLNKLKLDELAINHIKQAYSNDPEITELCNKVEATGIRIGRTY